MKAARLHFANKKAARSCDGAALCVLLRKKLSGFVFARFTREADIVVVAAGRPRTLTADMVRPGAVIIDVGVNRVPDSTKAAGHRLEGDVDFDAVAEKASAITPVPGGVGPMTIAMLLHNTVVAACRRRGISA